MRLTLAACLRVAVPAALFAVTPAFAQTYTLDCTNYGLSVVEPIGDRPDHGIQVSTATCRVSGGLLDGAIFTQQTVWEVDGAKAKLLDGVNVIRKPGALAVIKFLSGTRNLIVEDGRTIGYTASGTGQFVVATGTASPYAGKFNSWKSGSRTAGRFTAEANVE